MENFSGFTHPKDGLPTDYRARKNYRPVSLSKVFERLVLKQLISYIDELSLLAPSLSDLVSARTILL